MATAALTGRVLSKDGTTIAYTKTGQGPALILVDGALCSRQMGPMTDLAPLLASSFTVYTYDRRGRGESGDTKPYAVEREIEDIAALAKEAGGPVRLFGISSGAMLALEAATVLPDVEKLALYEAPLIVDDSRKPIPEAYWAELRDHLAHERRPQALKMFLRAVGMPGPLVALMPLFPPWAKMKAIAPTLAHDHALVGAYQLGKPLPAHRWTGATMPTLVMDGGKSPAWMRNAAKALAGAIPHARHETLEGQNHMVDVKVLAPVLQRFLA